MLAEDMKPSRLEVSKKIIWEFVGGLKNDRVWVTIFAGKPFVSLPLNFDYNVTRKIIWDISVDTIDQRTFRMQGTAIWDALVLAWESFDIDDNREKIIILLTDGEANKWLQPMAAVQYLKWKLGDRVKLYTIWIGWWEKTFVVLDDWFWWKNKIEVAWVDEKKLQDIAWVTGWKYFRASDEKSMESIFETIGKLEKHELETEYFTVSKPKNSIFVFLLVCFFFGFISLIIRKKI
jgi:Ca-activated chloride channel family protein